MAQPRSSWAVLEPPAHQGSTPLGSADAGFMVPLDFNGATRQSPFDVGAYETEGQASNPGWRIVAGFKPLTTP